MKKELSAGTKDEQRTNVDNSTSASVEASPMLCDAFRVYKELSDGAKLWFGTHRNENMEFEKNIFSGWRPNAYLLSKEVAESICQKYGAKMEAAF
jgi:hypothetical protein